MSDKPRILVIPDLFPRYDGDVRGIFILDWLQCMEANYDLTVLTVNIHADDKGREESTTANGIRVIRLNLPKPTSKFRKALFYRHYFKQAVKAVAAEKPFNLIHAHGAILSGSVAKRLADRWQVPFIITEHTGPFSTISSVGWKLKWARKMLEAANLVTVVSAHLQSEMEAAGIKPRQIVVTGNPVDTELFTPSPDHPKNILFVSRLDRFKGGLRTLQAFAQIAPQHPDWRLTIGGDGEEREDIKAFIKSAGLANRVRMLGHLSKQEVAYAFREAAFLVFPSEHESFGLVAAEALSAGLPVIATNQSAPREYVNEGNGLLVNPHKVEAIATAMEQMIGSLSHYDRSAIRQEIVERYGFDAFGKSLAGIWNELR